MISGIAPLELKPEGNIGPAPLTNLQRVLAGPTIIVDATIVLDGPIDPALLVTSAQAVCRRHEALRTTIALAESIQVVHEYSPDAVGVAQVSAEPGRLLDRVNEIAKQELDPARLPVFRCVVVTETPERSAVYLAAPHAVSDLASLQVIVRDFLQVLRGLLTGQHPQLPDLRAQFGDYLRWRNELLAAELTWADGGAGRRAMDFWSGKLAGALPAPFGHAGTVERFDRMTFLCARIDAATTARMVQVCAQSHSSLFHAVLAAFEEAVARETGVDDVTTMCLLHGRGRPQLRDTVGLLTEDVAFRHRVQAATRGAYLGHLARDAFLTYAHQDIPLSALAQRSAEVGRLYAHRRLRGMLLQFRPTVIGAGMAPDLPGVRLSFPPGVGALAAFALPGIALLTVDDVGAGLTVELMYDPVCWPPTAMARLFDGFLLSFETFSRQPDNPLGDEIPG